MLRVVCYKYQVYLVGLYQIFFLFTDPFCIIILSMVVEKDVKMIFVTFFDSVFNYVNFCFTYSTQGSVIRQKHIYECYVFLISLFYLFIYGDSLALLSSLEYSVIAHYSLKLLVSGHPLTAGFWEARTMGSCHHAHLSFNILAEIGSCHFAQAGLELPASNNSFILASQSTGIKSVSQQRLPHYCYKKCLLFLNNHLCICIWII